MIFSHLNCFGSLLRTHNSRVKSVQILQTVRAQRSVVPINLEDSLHTCMYFFLLSVTEIAIKVCKRQYMYIQIGCSMEI